MTTQKTYIIFGASGDLSKRYLLPALRNIDIETILISRKDYPNLKKLIKEDGQKIFHLAIPPEGVPDAIKIISKNFDQEKKENIKILLEKPFGSDLQSAQKLVEYISKYFSETQIYRVDHYLAKKSLHQVVEKKWQEENKEENIESIEIIASEVIGIEGRANFYEKTGALKDFVQSHLLEMAASVLAQSLEPSRRFGALRNLEVVCDITREECVKRGQYEGYREEVGDPESMTETFVSINLVSNEPEWRGVAIKLATGKAMKEKRTEVRINYKNKKNLTFDIKHEKGVYGRVIQAAIEGNRNLFISSGEILESWRILNAIEQSWKLSKDDLVIYPKGSEIGKI